MGGALTQGKGTPWGASRYGDPTAKAIPEFTQFNPNNYQSFDRSELVNRAAAGMQQDTATEKARAAAKLSQMGGGRSTGANKILGNIQAQSENRLGQMRANAAEKGWADALQQWAAQNQYGLNKSQLEQAQYATQAGLAQQEREGRRKALADMGLGALNYFGNY